MTRTADDRKRITSGVAVLGWTLAEYGGTAWKKVG